MIRFLCTLIFKLSGWKFVDTLPKDLRSFVMLGAPHTSNYDFIPSMALAYLMKRNARFVIKSEWVRFPLNLLMVPAGAIGVKRDLSKEDKVKSMTDVMADLFNQYQDLVLMIAPEGTRKPNPHWRTGFYYIAQKAKVPLVLGYADYKKKEVGLGPVIYLNNLQDDMKTITKFYQGVQGKKPENFKLDESYL